MLKALAPRRRIAPILLAALLAVALLLQGYRYPFQINSSETSPTYSDTPTWIQLGKWGVIAALALALLATQLSGLRGAVAALSRVQWTLIALQAIVLGISLSLVARRVPSTEPATMALLAVVGLTVTLLAARGRVNGRLLVTALVVYAIAALVVDVVQVALYLAVDRLPALAYYRSPSVRFGSILDDPNGFAVVLAALVAASWFGLQRQPNVRAVVVVGLLCCLPLTQSWTGSATTTAALVVAWALLRGVHRDLRRAVAVAAIAVAVVGTAAFFARATLAELVRLKHGSVEAHERAITYLGSNATPTASASAATGVTASSGSVVPSTAPIPPAILAPHVTTPSSVSPPSAPAIHHAAAPLWTFHIESGYVNILVNYGWVLLTAYLLLGIVSVALLLRRESGLPLALRASAAAYLIGYLLACANLGLDRTFPCNLLFFVFCGLSAYQVAGERNPRTRAVRADREVRARAARVRAPLPAGAHHEAVAMQSGAAGRA